MIIALVARLQIIISGLSGIHILMKYENVRDFDKFTSKLEKIHAMSPEEKKNSRVKLL